MSKFSQDDHVRVTDPKHTQFDEVGVVTTVARQVRYWSYVIRTSNGLFILDEHHLILAEPTVTETINEMLAESEPSTAVRVAANNARFVAGLAKKDAAKKSVGMDEREISGEYVPGLAAAEFGTPCLTAEQWEAAIEPDPVSAPSHYRSHPSGIETITITRHESFLRGNVLKYVLRAPYKGSEIEDLKKAAQYLQWEIDRAEAAQ